MSTQGAAAHRSRKGRKAPQTFDPGIEAIRGALEGPVIDVFRREIPELRHLPRPAAYDAVMNDPKMLDRCFRLFRAKPDLFAEVVTDQDHRPAVLDAAVLSCGRTLAEGVALVVRASARRYFRAKLDFRSRFAKPEPKPALVKRLAMSLGLLAPPPPPPRLAKPPSRAEALYHALRDYLRFDWQVLLIPHYAPMTPALVADLGPRLLEVREASELQALSAPGATPKDSLPPLLFDTAQRLMMPGRDAIDAEILWRVVQQMDLGRLFPKSDPTQLRRSVAQVSTLHAEVIKVLMPVLGGEIRRFTAFVMIAFTTLGEQRFKQDFCHSGQVHAVRKLAERIAGIEPPAPSLDEMTRVYQAVLGTAYTGGIEVGASGSSILKARPELRKALDSMGGIPASISG
ncbi:hypothetical protein A6A04_11260 [Paramagnetospirillum marisnigri]|uniref:Uncharacterized protein n=1 Tax=Paramagnetospirillum marisnigri TaxID=1285242 RepID=A0A178MWM2_9PROT|nr:hypothetical protein [Paramagnetospirillum marisnigri]OAN55232.1 hypothetical protein A6A04_11260 [Paramagnetospirillum marisnigri]